MDHKDRLPPSDEKNASQEHVDTPDPFADFDLSESVGYSALSGLDVGECTEQDDALLQSLFPTRVVFHQVPTTGRSDAVVQEFVRLEKTPLDLRHVPEVSVFIQLRAEFPWLEETISVLDHACMLARRVMASCGCRLYYWWALRASARHHSFDAFASWRRCRIW